MVRGCGSEPSPYLTFQCEGKKLKCLLSTGCEHSAMPLRVVAEMRLGCTKGEIFATDGAQSATHDVATTPLPLMLDGMPVPEVAFLSDDIQVPTLGSKWMMENECILDFKNWTVVVRGRPFLLEKGEESAPVHQEARVTGSEGVAPRDQ